MLLERSSSKTLSLDTQPPSPLYANPSTPNSPSPFSPPLLFLFILFFTLGGGSIGTTQCLYWRQLLCGADDISFRCSCAGVFPSALGLSQELILFSGALGSLLCRRRERVYQRARPNNARPHSMAFSGRSLVLRSASCLILGVFQTSVSHSLSGR